MNPGISSAVSGVREPVRRVTELTAPPVVGEWYLVPTVFWGWSTVAPRAWPVFLPLHEDARFFDFKDEHYHIDPRFLNVRDWAAAGTYGLDALDYTQRSPLSTKRWGQWAKDPPAPIWKRKRCARSDAPYQHGHRAPVANLRAHYAGQTCKHNRHGWVCPHQNWPMGSLAPDSEGVITCPLHGLRVRASDGLVLADTSDASLGPGSTPSQKEES